MYDACHLAGSLGSWSCSSGRPMIKRLDEWRAHYPKIIVSNDKIKKEHTAVIVLTILTYLTFDKNANNCEKLSRVALIPAAVPLGDGVLECRPICCSFRVCDVSSCGRRSGGLAAAVAVEAGQHVRPEQHLQPAGVQPATHRRLRPARLGQRHRQHAPLWQAGPGTDRLGTCPVPVSRRSVPVRRRPVPVRRRPVPCAPVPVAVICLHMSLSKTWPALSDSYSIHDHKQVIKGTNPPLKKSSIIPELYAKMLRTFYWACL